MAAPVPAAAIKRSNRSSGSSGASHGLAARARAPCDMAHVSPTLTPASGPVASPGMSCRTGRPSARASASASVPGRALTATVAQLRRNRVTAHISNGLPARTATAFSPPKRTERPPAMTTPQTVPGPRCSAAFGFTAGTGDALVGGTSVGCTFAGPHKSVLPGTQYTTQYSVPGVWRTGCLHRCVWGLEK